MSVIKGFLRYFACFLVRMTVRTAQNHLPRKGKICCRKWICFCHLKSKKQISKLNETTVRDIGDSYKREFNIRKRKLDYNEPETVEINDIMPKEKRR